MSFISKSLLVTMTVAIFGVAALHLTNDASATHKVSTAAVLPDVNSFRSSEPAANEKNGSGQRATDHFQKLKDLLEAARTAAEAMPGYSAILEMQEELDDELRPVDRIEFKTRRKPFSAYMRWIDSEQEAFSVGENDDRVIVKPSKGLAAIRRVWRLDPDCRMAMQTCRYPITDVGIENLVIRIQSFYNEPRNWSDLAECQSSGGTFAGQEVTVVEVKFKDRKSVPKYSTSKFCFENSSQLLVGVDNFGWTDGQVPRLVEHYVYREIKVTEQPNDNDFTEANPAYEFVKR